MPYNPGVTDRSGEFIAAGISSAASSISKGITTWGANKEQMARDNAKIKGINAADPSIAQDLESGLANPDGSSIDADILKSYDRIKKGKGDIYDTAAIGSYYEGALQQRQTMAADNLRKQQTLLLEADRQAKQQKAAEDAASSANFQKFIQVDQGKGSGVMQAGQWDSRYQQLNGTPPQLVTQPRTGQANAFFNAVGPMSGAQPAVPQPGQAAMQFFNQARSGAMDEQRPVPEFAAIEESSTPSLQRRGMEFYQTFGRTPNESERSALVAGGSREEMTLARIAAGEREAAIRAEGTATAAQLRKEAEDAKISQRIAAGELQTRTDEDGLKYYRKGTGWEIVPNQIPKNENYAAIERLVKSGAWTRERGDKAIGASIEHSQQFSPNMWGSIPVPGAPRAPQAPQAPGLGSRPRISTQREYDQLPSGAEYIDPSGMVGKKP